MLQTTSLRTLSTKIDKIINSTIESTVLLAREIEASLAEIKDVKLEHLLEPSVRKTIQDHIKQTLNSNGYCAGAGFASHIESSVSNKEFWLLEWWYKKADGVKQVNLDLDQATQQRLDFRTFEWFKQAPSVDNAFIHGPYVDYICNTSYTLTCAVPVHFQDQFLGVAAIDLLVSRVEDELLPYAANDKVILTNKERRIIFSTHPRFRVGDLLDASVTNIVFENDYFNLYM
ncbi:cache domain-containing protein [Buttiauxella sp. A2-C2_NF]|uniref:cache domain-containing protein n=1 Tax=Buttiauxella TaxID=82976 RepID=UPI001E2D8BDD|nr:MULTISPECIES: cache domain-containing protein [Buttiauxella]MCE0827750.1 cache domain-containing protein [Buttiauxella ferragutiae]